jgi:hypothetical protein
MTKVELYDLIKLHKPQYDTFAIDCLLANHGHTVVRLPPYHPDLNPIENIWGIVKSRIAAKNVTFTLGDVHKLAEENFAAVTIEEWSAVCEHVKVLEQQYLSTEHKMDSAMERFIINADDDDTSDSDDDIQGVSPLSSDSE